MPSTTYPPIEAVRRTLCEVETPALEVFKATGLSPSWQQAFREGRAKDPGYSRICTLVDWLNETHSDALANNVGQHSTVSEEC